MNMVRKILLDQAHAYWLAIYNTPGLAQSERALAGLMLNEIGAMGAEVRAAGAPVAEPQPSAEVPPAAGPAAQTRNLFAAPSRADKAAADPSRHPDATPVDMNARTEVERRSPGIFPGSAAAQ